MLLLITYILVLNLHFIISQVWKFSFLSVFISTNAIFIIESEAPFLWYLKYDTKFHWIFLEFFAICCRKSLWFEFCETFLISYAEKWAAKRREEQLWRLELMESRLSRSLILPSTHFLLMVWFSVLYTFLLFRVILLDSSVLIVGITTVFLFFFLFFPFCVENSVFDRFHGSNISFLSLFRWINNWIYIMNDELWILWLSPHFN